MGITVIVDSQRLNALELCARKHDLIFNQHWTPIEKADYFERGELMHKMLEYYYKLRRHRKYWGLNNKTHADVVDSCVKIGQHFAVKMQLPIEEVVEIIHQFREYCTYYADDGWETLAVEQPACAVLYEDEELRIIYETKIDLITSLRNIPILPVDHKTSRRREDKKGISNQFLGYCWIIGVNTIVENRIGFQKTLKPEERFQRVPISYPSDIIAEWVESVVWYVKSLIHYQQTGYYPPNFTSCDKWAGCVFAGVCQTERDARDWKLKRDFEVGPEWDVGKGL